MHRHELEKKVHINTHLQNSWNKHGKDNFIFEILVECSPEELLQLEQYYLDFYKPDYNIRKIADRNLGVKMSKVHREHLSKVKRGLIPSKKSLKIEEKKKRTSTYNIGLEMQKPVCKICPETLLQIECYKSLTEAATVNNMAISSISKSINGTRKISNGFIWRYKDDPVDKYVFCRKDKQELFKTWRKEVFQINTLGEIIKIWDSALTIEEELGLSRPNIVAVCNDLYKKNNSPRLLYGFHWCYEKDLEQLQFIVKQNNINK